VVVADVWVSTHVEGEGCVQADTPLLVDGLSPPQRSGSPRIHQIPTAASVMADSDGALSGLEWTRKEILGGQVRPLVGCRKRRPAPGTNADGDRTRERGGGAPPGCQDIRAPRREAADFDARCGPGCQVHLAGRAGHHVSRIL